MKIQSMFQKDIDRPINGVVKVMQDDQQSLKDELSEYIITNCLLYTSPSPRDTERSRMPSSA